MGRAPSTLLGDLAHKQWEGRRQRTGLQGRQAFRVRAPRALLTILPISIRDFQSRKEGL
jgi:hypothetical protein